MKKSKLKSIFLFLAVALIYSGCDTIENNQSSLSLNFTTKSTIPKISNNNLEIQEVKILIKDIKIKDQTKDDTLQIKTGPYVINLNLNGELTEFAVSDIPEGTYNRIKFEIHRLAASEVPPDSSFAEGGDPTMRYSVIVKGLINGEQFVYKSKKSAKQDVKLDEDVLVKENEIVNLTIKVDVYSWFYNGDVFLNPNDSANDDKIDNNIKDNFKHAYRDQNKDGQSDL